MFDNADESRGFTALVIVIILIFGVLIGLYLASLDSSGQTYTLTLTTIHDSVIIRFYNPLLVGETVINQGNTEFQLPQGHYIIKAELHRDYTEDIEWKCTINLNRDLEVKVFG